MPNNSTEGSGQLFPEDMAAQSIDDEEDPETATTGTEATETDSVADNSMFDGVTKLSGQSTPETKQTDQTSQTDLADPETDQTGTEPADDQMAFIENGLTKNEAIALIGVTVPSYALAAFILQQMNSHGIHHAPPALWVVFGILVIIPIALLFGTSLATRLLEQITTSRRKHP